MTDKQEEQEEEGENVESITYGFAVGKNSSTLWFKSYLEALECTLPTLFLGCRESLRCTIRLLQMVNWRSR